jgi:hypothetical protein
MEVKYQSMKNMPLISWLGFSLSIYDLQTNPPHHPHIGHQFMGLSG